MRFLLKSLNPKIWSLCQKVCSVAREHTDRQTHRVTTEGTLSGFQDFFLQPIIKDRPKNYFFCFSKFSFLRFLQTFFDFFSYTTLVNFCLSVCPRATGHTFWPRNLIFGLNDPWDMRKKSFFLFFRNFHFYAFYRDFSLYKYNTS